MNCFYSSELKHRLFLALAAGALWWPVVSIPVESNATWYLTAGIFSLLILVPYLDAAHRYRPIKAMVLILSGVISYALAIQVFSELYFSIPRPIGAAVAGACGAIVIGAVCWLLISSRLGIKGLCLLLIAGALGGFWVGLGYEVGRELTMRTAEGNPIIIGLLLTEPLGSREVLAMWPGHMAWEILICWVLHLSIQGKFP